MTLGMNELFRMLNPRPTTRTPTPRPQTLPSAPAGDYYERAINQDGIWQQLQAQLAAQAVANDTTRNQAITTGIGRSGYTIDPGVLSQLGIDPGSPSGQSILNTLQGANPLAEANNRAGLSTKARYEQQNKEAIRNLMNALGARGLARSGQTGHELQQQDQTFRQQNADSLSSLIDYFSGAQSAYTQAEQGRQAQYNTGLHDAATRAYTAADQLGMGAQPPTYKPPAAPKPYVSPAATAAPAKRRELGLYG